VDFHQLPAQGSTDTAPSIKSPKWRLEKRIAKMAMVSDRQNGDVKADRFTKDTEKITGMSERTVQRKVERAIPGRSIPANRACRLWNCHA
jgi:hypothetical protein